MGVQFYGGIFSTKQALVASAASDYTLDLGVTKPNLGTGKRLVAAIVVNTAFAAATSYTFTLQFSADAAFTVPVTGGTTGAIAIASLTKGAKFKIPIPDEHLRYARMYYTEAGSTETAGVVSAQIEQG